MATKSTDTLLWGPSVLLAADYGSEPTATLGYSREPIKVEATRDISEDYVQEMLGTVNTVTTKVGAKVTGSLAQIDAETLGRVLGVTPDGGKLTFGGEPEELEIALRIVSSRKNRSPVHFIMPRARSVDAFSLDFSKENPTNLAFGFMALLDNNIMLQILVASAVQDATLATGTFARTQASPGKYISWCRVAGEGAAADALTDITAADLADGEIVRLCIKSKAQPITVTHATGTIELTGAADFAMTKVSQWLDLKYDLANTKWVELARYEAL